MSNFDLKELLDPEVFGAFPGRPLIGVPMGWKVVRATPHFVNEYMVIITIMYELPDETFERKTLILRQPGGLIMATRDGGHGLEVLVIEQLRHGPGGLLMELPGGMTRGDETARDAAIRVAKQEVGLALGDNLIRLCTVFRDSSRSSMRGIVYHAHVPAGTKLLSTSDSSGKHILSTRWIPFITLVEKMARGEGLDAMLSSAVGTLLAQQFVAR